MASVRLNSDTFGSVAVDRVTWRASYGTPDNAVSVGVGAAGTRVQTAPGAAAMTPTALQAVPDGPLASAPVGPVGPVYHTVMPAFGMAYRRAFAGQYQLNMEATRTASLSSQVRDSLAETHVGIEYTRPRNGNAAGVSGGSSAIGIDQGQLLMKMTSNGNFALKIRHGGPMFYMRSHF